MDGKDMKLARNSLLLPLAATLLVAGCSNGSPANPVPLAVGGTAITRIDAGGTVSLKKVNVGWGNLPGNTTQVDLEKQPNGGARTKLNTFPSTTITYSDSNVDVGNTYSYFVTAFDAASNPI